MTMNSVIAASNDVFPVLVAGLEREFASDGIEALARRFLQAEAADFHWEARSGERHLGAFEAWDEDDEEWDRVAVIGCLEGRWYVAVMVVDGEGRVDRMTGLRGFESAWDAHGAYIDLA